MTGVKTDVKPDVNTVWPKLEEVVLRLLKRDSVPKLKFMSLYQDVYSCCQVNSKIVQIPSKNPENQKGMKKEVVLGGGELYSRLQNLLGQQLTELFDKIISFNQEEILQEYLNHWEKYTSISKQLGFLFGYLDRHFIKREREMGRDFYPIHELHLVCWRETSFNTFSKIATDVTLNMIERERKGEAINRNIIKCFVNCLLELSQVEDPPSKIRKVYTLTFPEDDIKPPKKEVYKDVLEAPFLKKTEEYYNRESSAQLQNPFTQYMIFVEEALVKEDKRIQHYLDTITTPIVTELLHRILIEEKREQFEAEFPSLVSKEKMDDLRRMHLLLQKIPDGNKSFVSILERFVARQGNDAILRLGEEAQDPIKFVTAILEVHKKYQQMVSTSFNGDANFVTALDKACTKFVNDNAVTKAANNPGKISEMLAKFCDQLLKTGKTSNDGNFDSTLEQVIFVFRYIEDKDVFQKFYTGHLAKRLIWNTIASDSAEEFVISKLKEICGFEYTNKMTRMYKDIELAKGLNNEFKKSKATSDIDFNVQVLTYGSWPFSQGIEFPLPPQLQRCVEEFTTFYTNRHNAKRLKWLSNLGKGEVVANCFKRKFTFQVSTIQIPVLLQFNNDIVLTCQDISDRTGIEVGIVVQVLQNLIKAKLLIGEEKLTGSSQVRLNLDYNNKKVRVNIFAMLKSEVKVEQEATEKTVLEDRRNMIQAAIVRIMKMNKKLSHQQLIAEVLKQLSSRFKPDVKSIKKNIEVLIEKEYMERSKDDKDTYTYIS